MTLAPGTKLGPYEVVAPLGAGGMGEVFRARDARLGRDVAIKALPEGFAQDAERLARFEREARLLASLNHPNVAGIHGFEEVEGHRYLVLEFVEGETLAAHLERGALPVDEALEICRQVAAGVEAAHEAGVVHRDLKPGNVMLKPDGTVKVLDFGLAKSGGPDRPGSDPNLSASPTLTAAATSAGVILGTAAYMSPEQARGRAVDKRSDVWSFGCVLYECLTGRQAFHGETVSDTIASILKTEADLSRLPAETPARVRELLARCLTKDAKERLRDIGEARVVLGGARAGEEAASAAAPATGRGRGVPVWAAAALALAAAALAVAVVQFSRPRSAAAPVRRLDLVADGVEMDWFFTPQLSPDGRRIAYISKEKVWIRDLEQLEPRAVADIGGLTPLAWSPDSRTLFYNDAGKLWKLPADGGAPFAICAVPGTGTVIGVTISRSGMVAFSAWRGGMYQVPVDGGSPALMFDIDPQRMVDFHAPSWLPNGDLLHVVHWKGVADTAGPRRTELAVFDGRRTIPVEGDLGGGDGQPTFLSGRLLYVRHDASPGIWAVPYDVGRRRVTGKPVLVAASAASLSVSGDGSLLYMEGGEEEGLHQMLWVDRAGKPLEDIGGEYPGLSGLALSPDGRRIAFTTTKGGNEDVWVRDLSRGIDTRITFSPAREGNPAWVSSTALSYVEVEGVSKYRIYRVNADGSGQKQLMTREEGTGYQQAYLAPGADSALRVIEDAGHKRIRSAAVLPDGSLGPVRPFLRFQPEPDVGEVRLSPDGRFVAYATDDPGQPEVFLTRFPSGDGRWQVSTDGARRPRWAAGSRELFYIGGAGPSRRALVAVKVDERQDPPSGMATKLFDIDPRWLRFGEMPYDVTPDGGRFLMAREAAGEHARPARMVLVQNWEAGLAARASR